MKKTLLASVVAIWVVVGACGFYEQKTQTLVNAAQKTPTPIHTYQIVKAYPHDREAFTQGLVYHNGFLYEGTGLNGRSSLRRVELETGKVLQIHHLDDRYFGEGITLWQDQIIQLTWTSQVGFVYNRETFEKLREFTYPTEGWGITHDTQHLIMSDGTDTLYFLDPETFEVLRRLQVRDQDKPVVRLNELEYVKGEIWANVWQTDFIARISPETGQVLGWIDLRGLLGATERSKASPSDQGSSDATHSVSDRTFNLPTVDVLNGIAYDEEGDRLFVTGKLWPQLFEIQLVGDR